MIKKFLSPFQNMVRADLFSGSLAVWNVRGGAAHFVPPEPRFARPNSVRAIFRIHRNLEKCKSTGPPPPRAAANSYAFLGENEKDLSIMAKEIFN